MSDRIDQQDFHTSWERIGEARSEARAILKEKRVILERSVSKKFGVTAEDHDLIARCDDSVNLDAAVDAVMDATTKDEVLQHLR